MEQVGLRELRQQASQLVKRVEAGEEMTITVSGRPAARLLPVDPPTWRPWEDLADLFRGPPDRDWQRDRDLLDQGLHDPWTGQ